MKLRTYEILAAAHKCGAVHRPVGPEIWSAVGRIAEAISEAQLSADDAETALSLARAMVGAAAERQKRRTGT